MQLRETAQNHTLRAQIQSAVGRSTPGWNPAARDLASCFWHALHTQLAGLLRRHGTVGLGKDDVITGYRNETV